MDFQGYNQQQNWLLPPSIEELIPANHPVRVVNGVIEQLNLDLLIQEYNKEGAPSYHPKMMLKVMVYAYMDNTYSSRKIEKAMGENINYMWLSAMQVADHNTIARFRSKRLRTIFKDIFKQVVLLLADEGLISLKEVFTDGTKIESVAGRYTFVWGNAIKTRKEKMAQQLEEMWQYAQSIADEEDKDPTPPDFKQIDKKKVEQTAEKITRILKDNPKASTKRKAKVRYIQKNYPETLDKYQEQEEILSDRNSYSKTDPDATFMRMKEDHMQNGQLKPGYNVQISSESQFVIHYTLHQQTNNSKKKRKPSEDFHKDNLYYNPQQDFYVCPMGQRMEKVSQHKTKTKSGYEQVSSVYKAKNCTGCPLRGLCHTSENERIIKRNHSLERHKQIIRKRLTSPEGIIKRKKRVADVEPVFGHIKSNRNFKRFTHRGIEKVELEFGLHALAHNLRKKAS